MRFCAKWNFNTVFFLFFILSNIFYNPTDSGSVQLTAANFDALLATHEVIFINFYADWCRFSQILAPVFDEAAEKIAAETDKGKALLGKVDCDAQQSLATRFHISKYPTLKLIRQGFVVKREYRGQRSAEALVNFMKEQLKDPIQEIKSQADLESVDEKKRLLIAYFEKKDVPHYDVYRRVAMNLRDDCDFYIGTGEEFASQRPSGDTIIFRPSYGKGGNKDRVYGGNMDSFDELNVWATDKCIPLVREITFENAEELTEEGLPFLILFHHPDDHEIVEKYTQEIQKQLVGDKTTINFLTADGLKFAHPLHHLGKTSQDLPLIAIDSFRHMYLFPDIKQMTEPGKLKQFVDDLYSGKLHREFHYGPDPTPQESEQQQTSDGEQPQDNKKAMTTPPVSTFRKLAPSPNRYTILRDEL